MVDFTNILRAVLKHIKAVIGPPKFQYIFGALQMAYSIGVGHNFDGQTKCCIIEM